FLWTGRRAECGGAMMGRSGESKRSHGCRAPKRDEKVRGRTSMPAEFSITHRVQFSETDLAGVVHFSNFFRWMEEVEHAFFRSLGLSVTMSSDAVEIGWPRISTSCECMGPAGFEDEVTLHMRITRVGDKSLNYEVDFLVGGRPIAKGKMTSVCCALTPEGFHSVPIPPAVKARLMGGS